ncbi:hypothetical protein ACTOJ1_000977 [Shigella flexneri]
MSKTNYELKENISIGAGGKHVELSFFFKDEHVVTASKLFDPSNENNNHEWEMFFRGELRLTRKEQQDLNFALMRLSDAMGDFDYNMQKEIEMDNIKKTGVDNSQCYFPDGIEGYWRSKPKKDETGLPFPVVNEVNVPEYSKEEFLKALAKKESNASKVQFKGWSNCRLTGEPNGSAEYSKNGWSWPSGYMSYIEKGVLPSRKFYQFIMGKDLEELIDYHN